MKNYKFRKFLAAGIILLFIAIGIQPAIADDPINLPKIVEEEIEPKEYLLQTIIEIANNPEVKDLLSQNGKKAGFFNYDNNFRNLYLKLLLRNPRTFLSMLFTRPSMTTNYLDSTLTKGCKIANTIGEDEVYDITESISISNPEFFEELDSIIMKNEELSTRIETLKEMKEEITPFVTSNGAAVICLVLGLILVPSFITALIYYGLAQLAQGNPAAVGVFIFVYAVFAGIALGCYYLMAAAGCFPAT
jgi:hypothetical protein